MAGTARGTVVVSFGASPGATQASVTITATDVEATSIPQAWIFPRATSETTSGDGTSHTADEHMVEPPLVYAGQPTAGSGFTIHAFARDGMAIGNWTIAWSY